MKTIKTHPAPKSVNEAIFDMLCQEICVCIRGYCGCVKTNKKVDCVSKFQDCLLQHLNVNTSIKWEKEYKKPRYPYLDRVDIFGDTNAYNWIIEIDTSRADQVAKKAFSRFALFGAGKKAKPFFYVAIVYPGTNSMNINEVIKYSRFGHEVAKKMNDNNEWRTIIIDCNNQCVKVISFNNIKFSVNGTGSYSMNRAVEKAVKEFFKQSKGNNFQSLEKKLIRFNNNHNGLQNIVSSRILPKNPINMQDGNKTKFYLTSQWSFLGESANFQEIIAFFKKHNIIIEPIWDTPCECVK